jgi:hypothetical protein
VTSVDGFTGALSAPIAALNGAAIRVGSRVWEVQPCGQRVDARYRWVQVILSGEATYALFLKMAPSAQADDAIQALRWWLTQPGCEDGDVLEVD